jgi:hypothetical protein
MKRAAHVIVLFLAVLTIVSAAAAVLPDADSLLGDSLQAPGKPLPAFYSVSEEVLIDMDHEDFGDWISVMPGYYPLERGGFGQPSRGLFLNLPMHSIELAFRGRKIEDHLLGAPELGWIPPGALSDLNFDLFASSTPGAALDVKLRTMSPVPPSSRISSRDGYYGLGIVDFDLSEKIAPEFILSGGGRVSTYGGYLSHSEAYGLNLRAEIVWVDTTDNPDRLWGWWGVSQNHLSSQIPFQDIDHNRKRYETDAVLHWRNITIHGYGLQQRETYASGDADTWQELGLILGAKYGQELLVFDLSAQGALADWRFKTQDWSRTVFGGAEAALTWRAHERVGLESFAGIDLSDDFDPASHFGVRTEATAIRWLSIFGDASFHQRMPSRYETSADFDTGIHYQPYDPVLFQYPDAPVHGNPGLTNVTLITADAGLKAQTGFLDGGLAYRCYQWQDPISWQIVDGTVSSFNGTEEEAAGVLGWFRLYPWQDLEIGGTGSYVPLNGTERLFPEAIGHAWVQYRKMLFNDQLDLRLRVWEDYWDQRSFPVSGGWESEQEDFLLSARIGARLYGFYIYWGVNNILDHHYELFPGFPMMHKEEVWGFSWNFIN